VRGRCDRGERLRSKASFGHWKTFVAALRCGALTAPWVIDAPMDRAIFDTYVETQLAPTLEKGDVVILDDQFAHKSPAAEQAIRERGARLLFLPPYSPDLNPIEMAFAKLKARVSAPSPCAPSTNSGTTSAKSAISSPHRNAQTTSQPPDMDSHDRPML
jgi:transposase